MNELSVFSDQTSIELSGVSKRFRRGGQHDALRDAIPAMWRRLWNRSEPERSDAFWAVRDVSFSVRRGEAIGLIGHNGAGKSTLLKLLSRILRADRGDVCVRGRVASLIELGAGFHSDLTGRENVYLNGAILGMKRREVDGKFGAIVDFAELHEFIDTPIKRYSSGMRARLGFSVAAHLDPDVLLVDEVLSVGDYHFQARCLERMRRFLDDGVTVVFVSHNMNAIGALCGRCVLLEAGEVIHDGLPAEAIEQYYALKSTSNVDNAGAGDSTAAVTVRDVRVEAESDQASGAFANGQRIRLRATIASRIDADVAIGMVLRDAHGQLVCDTASTRLGMAPVAMCRNDPFDVVFEFSVRFCPGTYHLSINVEDPLRRAYHAFARNVASFAVTDGHECDGICFVEPRVSIESAGRCGRDMLRAEAVEAVLV